MIPLFPYQEKTIAKMCEFLRSNETHAVYNASEPGLGKSREALEVLNQFNPIFFPLYTTTLIICPSVVKYVWVNEIGKWSNTPDTTKGVIIIPEIHISIVNSSKAFIPPHNPVGHSFVIISYDLVPKMEAQLSKLNFDFLILDEAHKVKSLKAKRTKSIFKHIWPNCTYKILLSGTPLTSNITDGFTAFNACDPVEFNNFYSFARRYAKSRLINIGSRIIITKYYGLKNGEELSKKIRAKFFVRDLKKDVMKDLPPKTWVKIDLDPMYELSMEEEDYKRAEVEANNLGVQVRLGVNVSTPPHLAGKRKLQGLLKIGPVCEFVEDFLEQEIPVVLFGWHTEVIKTYASTLAKFNPVIITGETPSKDRAQAVEDFQTGKTNLFIGNIQAAGVGITLTRASIAVFGELAWNPSDISQASDRIHRIGTKEPVTIYYLSCGKIDDIINETLISKAKVFSEVLNNETNSQRNQCA